MKSSLFSTFKYGVLLTVMGCMSVSAYSKPEKTPTWTDYRKAMEEHPHFKYQGEYLKGESVALQVLSTNGKFYTSLYQGGLPGNGWDETQIKHQWFDETGIKKLIRGFTKIDRSIKAGANPAPKNAVVLFNGKKGEMINGGKLVGDTLHAGFRSTESYKDITLHVEYLTPYKPDLPLTHPDRGNSGIYFNNAYEVQVMDSFAHDSDKSAWTNETQIKKPYSWNGSIYKVKEPRLNMSLPALHWQSFDIEFTAPRFSDGRKVKNAQMTVFHNGIKIHDRVDVSKPTGGREKNAETPGGWLYFQNHHNPVLYRNIWLIEKH